MALQVTGKNLDVGEALRTYVENRVKNTLDKYAGQSPSGHVRIEKTRGSFVTGCTIQLQSGLSLEARGEAPDAYASADQALDRHGVPLAAVPGGDASSVELPGNPGGAAVAGEHELEDQGAELHREPVRLLPVCLRQPGPVLAPLNATRPGPGDAHPYLDAVVVLHEN